VDVKNCIWFDSVVPIYGYSKLLSGGIFWVISR